jgi:hypothetical protein
MTAYIGQEIYKISLEHLVMTESNEMQRSISHEPEIRPSPETEFSIGLIFDFPVSTTVRKIAVLYKLPSVSYFAIAA